MTVYICSAYRAKTPEELQAHVEYAKELTRQVLLEGNAPITGHLYITTVVDDNDPNERSLALQADLELLARCESILVGQRFGISEGMSGEIERAQRLGIPIRWAA